MCDRRHTLRSVSDRLCLIRLEFLFEELLKSQEETTIPKFSDIFKWGYFDDFERLKLRRISNLSKFSLLIGNSRMLERVSGIFLNFFLIGLSPNQYVINLFSKLSKEECCHIWTAQKLVYISVLMWKFCTKLCMYTQIFMYACYLYN